VTLALTAHTLAPVAVIAAVILIAGCILIPIRFVWRLKRGDILEAGGSDQEQLFGRRSGSGAYGATILHNGKPSEHVTVLARSRREAERALKATYGKRNVSDVRPEDSAA
jgi:hypothetical protein